MSFTNDVFARLLTLMNRGICTLGWIGPFGLQSASLLLSPSATESLSSFSILCDSAWI